MDLLASLQDSTSEYPEYFVEPNFVKNQEPYAFHAFFGRQGGVSKGVWSSLNCGSGSEDKPENVRENYERLAEEVGLEADQVLTLHQHHSADCIVVEAPWDLAARPKADAMITNQRFLALGVLTADCAPVLFFAENDEGPVVAAAHAGWKGALGGILDSTVSKFQDFGVDSEGIKACVGPCIAQNSYEVGEEFIQQFMHEDEANEKFFQSGRKEGHAMFDLAGYCAAKLGKLGLKSVSLKDLDTYFNEEDFFSYRRATHRGEQDYGRQISLIYIK